MLNTFNTYEEITESNFDTAVLPLGSLEPKGAHLPIGFDFLLAERFAREFSSGKAVYLLPVWPFSSAMEARGFHGTVSLAQQTIWDVIGDLARVLARHAFKRLIILDFANYNWIVKQRVRELNLDSGVIQAVWVNPKAFAKEAADRTLLPDHGGGAVETAIGLAMDPSMVKRPVSDFDAGVPREYIDYRGLKTVSQVGHWGRPSRATEELGKGLWKLMMDRTREYVDYALALFPGGKPLAGDEREELWWPGGATPGVEAAGVDWRNSVTEISHNPTDTVILATGAIEQHSPAMPLATDHLQAVEIGRRVAAELKAYLLPSVPVVTSWCHMAFRGTLTLSAMTARALLEDIAASVHAGGFRKLAIVNVHGGNWVIKPALIESARVRPELLMIATGDIFAYRGQAPAEQLHAEEGEGSFIKAFYPACFKADKVVDFSPNCTASAFDLVGTAGVSPKGAWGYGSRATVEKGRSDAAARASEAAAYLKKTFTDLQARYPSRAK